MLSKAYRFSFKKGAPRRVFSSSSFTVRYDLNQKEGLHAAIVVGKKVDKKAVVRNKIKRRIAVIIQELLPKDLSLEIVVFAKKQISELSEVQIREELEKVLRTINKK